MIRHDQNLQFLAQSLEKLHLFERSPESITIVLLSGGCFQYFFDLMCFSYQLVRASTRKTLVGQSSILLRFTKMACILGLCYRTLCILVPGDRPTS